MCSFDICIPHLKACKICKIEKAEKSAIFADIQITDQVIARFKQNCIFSKIDIKLVIARFYMNIQNFR